ncbi:hypothetical protein F4604DRAFT_1930418 [Suillus subluteus]|nr:hypothetical protein F4604DRAFT_1930418 [Suillus subluteus]
MLCPVQDRGSEGKHLIGYILLPIQYQQVWLDLSYCIILYTQMWRMWAKEEPQNNEVVMLYWNCRAMVAQHTLARLLAVDEMVSLLHETATPRQERVCILNEWKICWYRDWFNTTYDKVVGTGARFLNADPVSPKNQAFCYGNAEGGWNIDKESKTLLSPPNDLEEWFEGEIKGLDEVVLGKNVQDALKEEGARWRKRKMTIAEPQVQNAQEEQADGSNWAGAKSEQQASSGPPDVDGILPPESSTSLLPPLLPPGSYARPQHEVAIEHFEEFLSNRSTNQYEAQMKVHYSSAYTAVIKEHIKDVRAWTNAKDSSSQAGALHTFIKALKAVSARKEAEQEQQDLL